MSALRGQLVEPLPIVCVVGVEHTRSLVGVVQRERNARPGYVGWLGPARVTAGGFDLEDVGAEVGEVSGHRVGVAVTQIQDPQFGQQHARQVSAWPCVRR